jgi:hypothetical protein
MFVIVRQNRFIRSVLLTILLLLSSGCAQWFGFPAYYDPTTYKQLTDLKPEVLRFYNKFTTEKIDQEKIDDICLKFERIYEYEKGKGLKNVETYRQIEIIQHLFERQVNDRLQNGVWSPVHLNNQKENISEAFDIAIRTENLKNKNI